MIVGRQLDDVFRMLMTELALAPIPERVFQLRQQEGLPLDVFSVPFNGSGARGNLVPAPPFMLTLLPQRSLCADDAGSTGGAESHRKRLAGLWCLLTLSEQIAVLEASNTGEEGTVLGKDREGNWDIRFKGGARRLLGRWYMSPFTFPSFLEYVPFTFPSFFPSAPTLRLAIKILFFSFLVKVGGLCSPRLYRSTTGDKHRAGGCAIPRRCCRDVHRGVCPVAVRFYLQEL